MSRTINLEQIQQINLFEKLTKARVKELITSNDSYIFIVEQGDINKALGKQAINIKKLSFMLRKKIKIVEFSQDIIKFTNNLFYPLKPEISLHENTIEISSDTKTKALLIGRDRRNFNIYSKLLKEYFKMDLHIK